MDWSSMFEAEVVVFGCGNTLFGDDGLAPTVVARLAADPEAPANTAFVDAGTSIRPLLTDLALSGSRPRRVILLDIVKEPGRMPGTICDEDLDRQDIADPAGGFLHQAPTLGLLRKLRDEAGTDVHVLTVQAAYIPDEMDDRMSPEATAALPHVMARVKELCNARSDA